MSRTNYDYIVGSESEISLDTGEDNSSALAGHIDWKDPLGNTGTWVATINLTLVQYTTSSTDLTVDGTWTFQVFIRRADSTEFHYNPVDRHVGPAIAGTGHTHS